MTSEDRLIKIGPAEISYYCNPQYFDLRGCNEISQIFVSGGADGIESIQFQYVENGKYVVSNRYGNGSITTNFHTIELNHPAEYITGVNGLYSQYGYNIQVITFTTNIQEYGPFGKKNADLKNLRSFTYNLGKSNQFGGFHGIYSTNTLTSLGVYLRAKAVPPSSGSKNPRK